MYLVNHRTQRLVLISPFLHHLYNNSSNMHGIQQTSQISIQNTVCITCDTISCIWQIVLIHATTPLDKLSLENLKINVNSTVFAHTVKFLLILPFSRSELIYRFFCANQGDKQPVYLMHQSPSNCGSNYNYSVDPEKIRQPVERRHESSTADEENNSHI